MKSLLARLFLGAVLLAIAACEKPPQNTPVAETPAPATSPIPEEKKLNIFCWSEYVPQDVINQFTKETGIDISMENFSSNQEMLARLETGGGNYDLIQPNDNMVAGLIKKHALEPLDHALIPNLQNIAPEFLNMPFDPGNKYSVPYMEVTVGIVVNTALVKDDIKSFNDVFQPKFRKKIVILDDPREIVSWALATKGIPINDVSNENLAKIKPVLSNWLPLVKLFDSDSPKTALLNGDAVIGVVWCGEGAYLLNADKKFKWVFPAEGSSLFMDCLTIPRGARHARNAQIFMNFILRPDISKKISDAFPYLNPNKAARALLSPEQLNNPASFPTEEQMARTHMYRDIGDQMGRIEALVEAVKVQ